ncbi:MAG: outer membrane beta-barrel protein [Syntrophales bacterium]|jgi:hypothetical protein|nr:outer membrane beta-barrel protein [Syntrophales bacterium]MDY0044947.1 outer membrane beta-barrel protein [Syntrophales bacterium]
MRKLVTGIIGLTLVFLIMQAHTVWAVGNIKIGLIEVHPSITEQGMWDSNIDLNAGTGPAEEERSDFINIISPAVTFNLNKPLLNVSLGVLVDVVRYMDYDENDATNYRIDFLSRYGELGKSGLFFKVRDSFADQTDPYAQADETGLIDPRYRSGEAVDYKSNTAGVEVGYGIGGLYSIHLSYTNNWLKYDSVRDEDSNKREHVIGTALYYKVMPKTFAKIGYAYSIREFFDYQTESRLNPGTFPADIGKDSKSHDVTLGLVWDQTEKLNGEVNVGYRWQRYDNRLDNFENPLKDFNTWTVGVGLGWLPRPRTLVNFTAIKGEVDSVDDLYYSYDQLLVGIDVRQTVVHKLVINVGGDYEIDDYNSDVTSREKEFNIYRLSAGFDYQIMDWLSAGVAYTFKELSANSEWPGEEYTDHITMFKITGSL